VGFFLVIDIYIKLKSIMKKIIRMTEADLTKLVKRVIQEQAQIRSVTDTMSKPAPKQSVGKLTDTMSKPAPKQSVGTISATMMKEDPKEWFSNFPCIKNLPASQQKIVGGKIYNKTDGGKTFVLLPETGTYQEKGFKEAREDALNDYVGKIQGGGHYYCSKRFASTRLGPVIKSDRL
jgi:hypothetical protein